MKSYLLITLLFFPFSAKSDWLEAYGYVIMGADWLQTHEIVKHPDKWKEQNPFLGEHPSMRKVNLYLGSFMLGHYLINKYARRDIRNIWNISIGISKTLVVEHNYSIGLRIDF